MLRFIYGRELAHYPKLARTMFTDRARVFRDRLGWPVSVTEEGEERDQYDALDPLYVIWQGADGTHHGSMRFLPTMGRTMVNEHFENVTKRQIASKNVWECTRFCLSDQAGPHVSAGLMLGGAELGLGFGLSHAVGVFDARMVRVYRMLGWSPDILGTAGEGADAISVGLWAFDDGLRARLSRKAHLPLGLSQLWFNRAFGAGLAKTG